MAQDWTEKHRPRALSEIAGNPAAADALLAWAKSWERGIPPKRAAVLMGPPGVGKTSAACALASDMGWDLVEMNASDQRTGDAIREVAARGSMSGSLDGGSGRRLVVLDEADNFFGNADRGAMPAVSELIKKTRQPLILIVNDFYALSKKSSAAKSDTLQITFRKPSAASVAKVLRKIAAAEGVEIDDEAIAGIAANAGGDVRAAVRDMESIAQGGGALTAADAGLLSERDSRSDMYAVLDMIFRKRDPSGARKALSKADADPETAILWIDENLPHEYSGGDLVRGYERLARADVFLGRVHRRQHYGFWSYAGDMMTAGVAAARLGGEVSRDRLRFPSYLSKMSRSKAVRASRAAVCLKLAILLHTSTKRIEQDVLEPLRWIASRDPAAAAALVRDGGLEPEELGFLLGEKADSAAVKAAARAAEEPAPVARPSPPASAERIPDAPPRQDAGARERAQRSLLDF
ncbi:MAG: replication factor C large subunit [Candidatus Methanoplasma sp.]|jgi:replication factor C large subunit|nr:replication factor C large subunit [Candidatus Methanoplasma sp.]